MKIELSCEIVRDLLPTYIDGLASYGTVESVEAHLKQCTACQHVYVGMKEENGAGGDEMQSNHMEAKAINSVEAEKRLFKKINYKVNKKVRRAVAAGVIGVVGAIGVMQVLFNMPLKHVPFDEVTVSASVYPIEEVVTGQAVLTDNTVQVSKGEGDAFSYSIRIPDIPSSNIAISKDMVEEKDYVSYITMEAPYLLKDVDWDTKIIDGESVMYITSFKTSLLGNKTASQNTIMPTLQFKKIDKILYVGANGKEEILWENEASK